MTILKQYNKHMLQPLNTVAELNTESRQDVLSSVRQLQIWTGDSTELKGLPIEKLLILQSKLEAEI